MGLDAILLDDDQNQIDLPEDVIQECCELFNPDTAERLQIGRLSDMSGPFFYAGTLGFILQTFELNPAHEEFIQMRKTLDDVRSKFDAEAASRRFTEHTDHVNRRYRESKNQCMIILAPIHGETDPEQFRKDAREWVGLLFLTPEIMKRKEAEWLNKALDAFLRAAVMMEKQFEEDSEDDMARSMHGLVVALYILDRYMVHVINHGGGYCVSY